MNQESEDRVRQKVRDRYAAAITDDESSGCCGPKKKNNNKTTSTTRSSCCGSREVDAGAEIPAGRVASMAGYSKDELKSVPADAVSNSFGCGNPLAFAQVLPGQTVVDIGSGAGIDCFLAAQRVGSGGRVIGIDMTPEMIRKARANAEKGGHRNVEFRQGVAENMPVEDGTADWIVSNCVINLSPNKPRVFAEAFRVLKPGGTLSVSDIMVESLPAALRNSDALYCSCIGGAIPEGEYIRGLRDAGFADVSVTDRIVYDRDQILGFAGGLSSKEIQSLAGKEDLADLVDREIVGKVWSAKIVARKPAAAEDVPKPPEIRYTMASPADEQEVRLLVDACGLPASDVGDHLGHFILARSGKDLAGCIGLEPGGEAGLLRSLAVAPRSRNKGLGRLLVGRLEEYARSLGVRRLYLLTTGASGFFSAAGYLRVERNSAPDAIRSSLQFTSLCPCSAELLMKNL